MEVEVMSTKNKALQLNLDSSIYGSFAEIGGGQEVARRFFQAGGASGTVAKTISAYDMAFSDQTYKSSDKRYVSEGRLLQMLDTEFHEVCTVLEGKHDPMTRFFSFANTVETINFRKDNQGHGWVGIRFQLKPGGKPNEVIIHVRLLDNDTLLQQNTLGVLGVNLVYASFYYHDRPNMFLKSLTDNLSSNRMEINMIRMTGPELDYVDNRLLSVQLVKNGMTEVTIFDRTGAVKQPSDMLYKKDVMVIRGSFRPITYVGFDMLKTGYALFKKDIKADFDKNNMLILSEITMNNLLSEGEFDERDFLDRVDILTGMGQNVMISNFREFYKLVGYLSPLKIRNLRLVLGADTLEKVIDKKYYTHLKGGTLEAFGRLFTDNCKLYVYPSLTSKEGVLLTSQSLPVPREIKFLYKHLLENQRIMDISGAKVKWLHIRSRDVLKLIRKGDHQWEKMVPVYVSDEIKDKTLFGYKGD